MTDAIDKELVDRMVEVIRQVADFGTRLDYSRAVVSPIPYEEAAAIAALLPKPIDPDLIEARRINAEMADKTAKPTTAQLYRDGKYDGKVPMETVLAGIKLGRKLAEEGR